MAFASFFSGVSATGNERGANSLYDLHSRLRAAAAGVPAPQQPCGSCARISGRRLEAAMATRRVGRSWEVSPTERRPPAGLRGNAAEDAAASPPVLSLSHFCRSPFLCFGDVRLGDSRTLPLVLDNPNDEITEVKISHFPAAEQGFSVSLRWFELQVGGGRGVPGPALRLPALLCPFWLQGCDLKKKPTNEGPLTSFH